MTGPYIPNYSDHQKQYMATKLTPITFILSGVAHTHQMQQQTTQKPKGNMKFQIHNMKDYKLRTQLTKKLTPYLEPGTTGEGQLQKKLLKECMTTSKLMNLYQQIQTATPLQRKRKHSQHSKTPKKKTKKSKHVSRVSAKKVHAHHKKHQPTSSSSSNSSTIQTIFNYSNYFNIQIL